MRIFSQSISAYEGFSASCMEQLQNMSILSPTYAEAINNFSSIATPLAEAFRSIDFDSLLASIQSEDGIEDFDDYVITDSHVIREIDLSDGIVLPVGNNRIKIKTDTFIALLSFLFAVFTVLFQSIGDKAPQEDTSLLLEQNQLLQEQNRLAQEQNELTREQNLLLREQNKVLLEILESVDASESSQADFFKDVKEALKEQAALFQMPPEAPEANQLSHGSYEESPDTVHEATDPTQKADGSTQKATDSTQPTTDTSLPAPNTGYDTE